jgi:hypothetical protein
VSCHNGGLLISEGMKLQLLNEALRGKVNNTYSSSGSS